MNIQTKARRFLLYLAGLGAAGCSNSPPEQQIGQGPPVASAASVAQPATAEAPTPASGACSLPVYDMEALNNRLTEEQSLPDKAVARLVRQYPRLPEMFRKTEDGLNLYALDTVSCPKFRLVSYLYQGYDYYAYLYYVTFSPDGRQLLDWTQVATIGADEGWYARAGMRLDPDGRLRVTALVQDASEPSSYVTDYQDSVVTAYRLTPQGRFQHTRLDSVRHSLPSPPPDAEPAG
ncbi:hypothetical protein [Hymenobacter sp. DG01]|uniref:hypothetical protein n=1 Tax=Hymenobacter sp. DG01 TaxID=2584940 RepID=UPI00111D9C6D|nr:hypothetical protein [Hymenobacter sp. DG01]